MKHSYLLELAVDSVVTPMMERFTNNLPIPSVAPQPATPTPNAASVLKVDAAPLFVHDSLATLDLNAMTKDELLQMATERKDIKVAKSWTKAKIIAALMPQAA